MSDATTLPAPDLGLEGTTTAAWEMSDGHSFDFRAERFWPPIGGNTSPCTKRHVIAEGPDQVAVAKGGLRWAGYVPIYVGLVTDEPPRPARIPSPRLPCAGSP